MFRDKVVVLCAFIVISYAAKNGVSNKDVIGFPEVEENPNIKNKENRQPVYLPATCPVNELYYPGDQKDDWICDCRPAFVYHPASDTCWPAFQRGPCKAGEYLTLPTDSVIPVCIKNPCGVDGYVQWNGKCQRLGTINPCSHLYPISAALGVNATTLVVSCVRLDLESRFGEDEDAPTTKSLVNPTTTSPLCSPGSRRSVNGKCVPDTL